MSDLTIQLLKLINEGKNLNEISETLHISHKKIFNYLTMIKNSGYDFKRRYPYLSVEKQPGCQSRNSNI